MVKRITSIMIAFVMVFSVIGLMPAKAEAATKQVYVLKNSYDDYEKIGNYYIWVKRSDDGTQKLQSCKLRGAVTPKVIKTVPGSGNKEIAYRFVTNGETVYFAIGTMNKYDEYTKVTVYKTDVKGKKIAAVKTFNERIDLAGFYNGKLYYTGGYSNVSKEGLYSYDVSSKKTKFIRKTYGVEDAYGQIFLLYNMKQIYRYNVANGTTANMPETGSGFTTDGKKVYYYEYMLDKDYDLTGVKVKSCDLNGKNRKHLKTFKFEDNGYSYIENFGHKNYFVYDYKGDIYRYNYSGNFTTSYVKNLKKVTLNSVKTSGSKAITVKWSKVNKAKKYQVYRATAKNGTYKLVKTTTATSWKNTGLTKGKTYYYKVRAVNFDTVGAYSAVKSVKAK